MAAARALEYEVEALACASTGNLAGADDQRPRRALEFPSLRVHPGRPRTGQGRVTGGSAYGATVSTEYEGAFDNENRLCLEVADKARLGLRRRQPAPVLRRGIEDARIRDRPSLGWRSPDVVDAPVASGAMFTRVARGFEELAELGLIKRQPIRFVGGQAEGCAPGRDSVGRRDDPARLRPDARHGPPLARRSATPAWRPATWSSWSTNYGPVEAIEDEVTAAAIRDVRGSRECLPG